MKCVIIIIIITIIYKPPEGVNSLHLKSSLKKKKDDKLFKSLQMCLLFFCLVLLQEMFSTAFKFCAISLQMSPFQYVSD